MSLTAEVGKETGFVARILTLELVFCLPPCPENNSKAPTYFISSKGDRRHKKMTGLVLCWKALILIFSLCIHMESTPTVAGLYVCIVEIHI